MVAGQRPDAPPTEQIRLEHPIDQLERHAGLHRQPFVLPAIEKRERGDVPHVARENPLEQPVRRRFDLRQRLSPSLMNGGSIIGTAVADLVRSVVRDDPKRDRLCVAGRQREVRHGTTVRDPPSPVMFNARTKTQSLASVRELDRLVACGRLDGRLLFAASGLCLLNVSVIGSQISRQLDVDLLSRAIRDS